VILFRILPTPPKPMLEAPNGPTASAFDYNRMWLIWVATQERKLWGQLGWMTTIMGERN